MTNRKSIYLEGGFHKNPIPHACLVKGVLYSSVINGVDINTDHIPDELNDQCKLVFCNVRAILEKADGTMDDIVKMNFWLKKLEDRKTLNIHWEDAFPDPENRPARQAFSCDLRDNLLVQCNFVAVL